VVNWNNQTPFHLAVLHECAVEVLQGSVAFDDVATAFAACKKDYAERLWPVIEQQCGCLLVSLNRDVVGTVYGYLGFEYPAKPKPRGVEKPSPRRSESRLWLLDD